jgi:hypothetical protein
MNDPRGSIWRKCDFHVHTPLSILENNFPTDFDQYVKQLFKKAIEKKDMDHWNYRLLHYRWL